MKTYDPGNIRNVLLAGHGGAGKTTLLEAMLFGTGAITRMGNIEDGNTVSDHDPEEVRKGISVSIGLAPVESGDVKINMIDAPGYADFVGDLYSAVRAADAVLIVVSAVEILQGQKVVKGQRLLILEAMKMEHGLPAPFDGTVAEVNAKAGAQVTEGQLLVRVEAQEEK